MVDDIKCCGQVEQGKDRQVAIVDYMVQNVQQYFQYGLLFTPLGVRHVILYDIMDSPL